MFNSIFRRIMVPTVGVALLLVVSLGITASVMYRNALIEEKHQSLEAGAKALSALASRHLEGQLSLEALDAAVDGAGAGSQTMVYLVQVTAAQLENGFELESTGLKDDFMLDHLRLILKGNSVFESTPYSDTFGAFILFQGYPIYLQGEVHGAVLLITPFEGIRQVLYDLNLTYAGIAAAALLLSLPLILWHSRHIAEPIRKMEATTRRLAAGEAVDLEPVVSKDEVGRLYDSFVQMKSALEQTEALRKELIANVSHELRTPLTSINGFVQCLMDGLVPEGEQGEILSLIKMETERLIRLTSDLLELAKLQAGKRPLQLKEISLEPLARQVMTGLKGMAASKGVHLNVQVSEDLVLLADEDGLKQILNNLLDNAVKYAFQGTVVELRAEQQGVNALISVVDSGRGIPEEAMERIFDKFYRAPASGGALSESGTGLGLSIVKALVLLHGGQIKAERNHPCGTKVTVTLPLKRELLRS